jgi:hypothetical protein
MGKEILNNGTNISYQKVPGEASWIRIPLPVLPIC